jgi:hypothetical protein
LLLVLPAEAAEAGNTERQRAWRVATHTKEGARPKDHITFQLHKDKFNLLI